MTSQTSRNTGWRRAVTGAVASGALVAGLMVGLGSGTASADPAADPTTEADAQQPMTADQALAIIAADYDVGAGGGELSNLIHQVMKLRSQGFYPSQSNKQDIEDALDKRPNQTPLIAALQATLAFQNQTKMRSGGTQAPATIGINQSNPGSNPGIFAPGASPGINIPLGP